MGSKYTKCFRPVDTIRKSLSPTERSTPFPTQVTESNVNASEDTNGCQTLPSKSDEDKEEESKICGAKSSCNLTDLQGHLTMLFYYCENNDGSNIVKLVNDYPIMEYIVNERHVCHLLKSSLELTPLQFSSILGHSSAISALLSFPSTSCNIPEPLNLMTALHLAVALGQISSIAALCYDCRVDLNAKNIDGKTAIHIAVETQQIEVLQTILRLRRTADLRVKDFDGNNALHFAVRNPSVPIMRTLLEHAAALDYFYPALGHNRHSLSSLSPPRIALDLSQCKRLFFSVRDYILLRLQTVISTMCHHTAGHQLPRRDCAGHPKAAAGATPTRKRGRGG